MKKALLIIIAIFAILYLGTAFVTLELNFAKWEAATRFLLLIEGIVISIGAVAISEISKEKI